MDMIVPLNRLKFGQEDGEGINARVVGRQEGIAALAANIFSNRSEANKSGLIENLIVKAAGDGFYSVANGNRRLAALHMMDGPNSDLPIAITLHDVDETKAFEYSLTTAITAEQLHPVDQYEAFARLEEHGKTHEEIAQQYGLSEKQVLQALALGRLSPGIREAWRTGEIDASIAKAFTLALEHQTQDNLLAKLQKAGHLHANMVRRELGASDLEIGELVAFVGADFYRECGGEIVEDLFGSAHIVSNVPKLKQIAADKLVTACEQLRGEGWSWAETMESLPSGARHWRSSEPKSLEYEGDEEEREKAIDAAIQANQDDDGEPVDYDLDERLHSELAAVRQAARRRSYTARQKSKSGCILSIEEGRLAIAFGVMQPEEVKVNGGTREPDAPAKGGPAAKATPEEPAISNALIHRLSLRLTEAAGLALSQDLELSLIVLLAGLACSDDRVRLSVRGLGASTMNLTGVSEFTENISLLRMMTLQERMALIPPIAAASLDFQNHPLDQDIDDKFNTSRAVCNAIDAKALNAALRGAFDAKDYFSGVNKALCLKAIEEALGPDLARQQSKNPKGDIAAFAIENVPPTGWLPVQLRANGYDGPPNGKPRAAAAKPARKPKPPAKAAAPMKKAAAGKKVAKKTAKKTSPKKKR